MKKSRIFLVILVSIFLFLLIYLPTHYNYPFPRHGDEWHHISEAIRIERGEYQWNVSGYRVGFHVFLSFLSRITNLVSIYKYLPAIWAVFSALILFFIVYRKTDKKFYLALLAMIFFASIKSNVNITGLWFFTPLSFSIPFIFLYVYFFSEGIEKQKKKYILISLIIMLVLLFFHPISVLFAIPFLFIYLLFNFEYLKKQWKFFSLFLSIPLVGIFFYKFINKTDWLSLISDLIALLRFKPDSRILEMNNSFFELYSLAGYLLAIIGLVIVLKNKDKLKKYSIYILWSITALILIMIQRITGVSYLASAQRNLYYFVISLPMLSAFGLDYLLKQIKAEEKIFQKTIVYIVLTMVIFLTFISYLETSYVTLSDPRAEIDIALYEIIDDDDYQALLFLSELPQSRVMASRIISMAIYPVSQQVPVATDFFYGAPGYLDAFFESEDCEIKQKILDKYKVKYILSESKIDCQWNLIYNKKPYIYEYK